MGHKINPIGFRLKNVWRQQWFTKDLYRKDDKSLSDLQLVNYISRIALRHKTLVFGFKILRNLGDLVLFFSLFSIEEEDCYKNMGKFFRDLKILRKRLEIRLDSYGELGAYNISNLKISFKFKYEFNLGIQNTIKYKQFLNYSRHFNDLVPLIGLVDASLKKKSAELLSLGLAYLLNRAKHQAKVMFILEKILLHFFNEGNNKLLSIRGLKIVVSGRFNGRARSQERVILINSVPTSTISASIDYKFSKVVTKFGVFGIKVWLSLKDPLPSSNYSFNIKNFKKYLFKNAVKTEKYKI